MNNLKPIGDIVDIYQVEFVLQRPIFTIPFVTMYEIVVYLGLDNFDLNISNYIKSTQQEFSADLKLDKITNLKLDKITKLQYKGIILEYTVCSKMLDIIIKTIPDNKFLTFYNDNRDDLGRYVSSTRYEQL